MSIVEFQGITQKVTTGKVDIRSEDLGKHVAGRYMFDNFFKHIDIDPNNANILDGNAPDLVKECQDYEKKIKEAGGIELFVGNI